MLTTAFQIGIVAGIGVLAVFAGSPVVTGFFRRIDRSREGQPITEAAEALRGGAWIGFLERVAIYSTLVAAWPMGLALIVAIKGLGRYPELTGQTRDVSERFIIGTFISALWACAWAGIAVWLIDLVA